eukprot:GILK01004437.1.p1 GENE.GILK01004437.1~~GILK01004437.1.p1  ORF type:complete len:534 (+),score=101.80 GILK01004437.1:84-1685(+)
MSSTSLVRLKAENEARLAEEKKTQERRRNLLVLLARHLVDHGYVDSAQRVQQETGVSLEKFDAADNIDLTYILQEFEDFYEFKFGRRPKLVRKALGESHEDRRLPRISSSGESDKQRDKRPPKQSSAPAPTVPPASDKTNERGGRSKSSRPQSAKREGGEKGSVGTEEGMDMNFAVSGSAVNKKSVVAAAVPKGAKAPDTDANDDFFDTRLLRPLPQWDAEWKELAAAISRDILLETPGVHWDDIVGLSEAKRLLKEAVIMPLKYPQYFTGLLTPWKGILLFGPPGTGKTMLAKAVATECRTTFFNISASSIVSKWRGDSEKLVRVLFELARHHQPTTIFIDELDSIMSQRGASEGEHEGSRRMKTELLIQMDGLLRSSDRVFLLAASNLPWELDMAMLRRLEKRILVPLPSLEARAAMWRHYLPAERACDLDYELLARRSEGYSGSDLRLAAKESAMRPLRRLMSELELSTDGLSLPSGLHSNNNHHDPSDSPPPLGPVTEEDVESALSCTRPSPMLHLDMYTKWQQEYGSI